MTYSTIRKSNATVSHSQRNSTLVNEMDTIYNGGHEEYEDAADCYRADRESVKAVRIA
jgi:hypothetical protein